MSRLKDNLTEIVTQKENLIIPENIRKDVTILGVTGTVEGGINITSGTVDGHTLILSSEPEIN